MIIPDALRAKGYPEPVKVTGWLYLVASHDALGNPTGTRTEWVGGKTISMSYGLLDMADSKYLVRDSDTVTLFGHVLHIIADCPELETVYLERQE